MPDVADYLRNSSVVVTPIRFGGGTRIKILEALAYRKAVVSTTKGAEGIEVQSGKNLLLADSPEDLAKACTLLLRDGALRNRLGEEGFRLIRDRYQWKSIEGMVGDIVLGHAHRANESSARGGGSRPQKWKDLATISQQVGVDAATLSNSMGSVSPRLSPWPLDCSSSHCTGSHLDEHSNVVVYWSLQV